MGRALPQFPVQHGSNTNYQTMTYIHTVGTTPLAWAMGLVCSLSKAALGV